MEAYIRTLEKRLTLLCLLALTARAFVNIYFFKILVDTIDQVKQISLID